MFIDFLQAVWRERAAEPAIIWRDAAFDYGRLLDRVAHWRAWAGAHGVAAGTVVSIEGDCSPNAVALMMALIDRAAICVPLTPSLGPSRQAFRAIGQVERRLLLDEADEVTVTAGGAPAHHRHYAALRRLGHPGLVLFSSGSTGEAKGIVHDVTRLLAKFRVRRKVLRSLSFMLYDHIGGFNTMMYQLANGSALVTVPARDPDTVLAAVERHRVEVLPVSPTFLNLMLMSEAWRRHDLSSLKVIPYGTEPMPEPTLRRLHELLPGVELRQQYGLSEVGVMRSRSRADDSLWVRLGGEGYQTRVVDGVLHIRAESAMLGYLNAPDPFLEDGWLNTEDRVEVDGEYFRILGRDSELINVGGEKVYPAEVEAAIEQLDNVLEAAVYGEANPITGRIVCARVRLAEPEPEKELARRLRRFCRERLRPCAVPVKVTVTDRPLHGARFKKLRRAGAVETMEDATDV